MSVTLYFGKTESGKSFRAKEDVAKKKRVVIFDFAYCFDDGEIVSDLSTENIQKLYKKFRERERYKIIARPPRNIDNDTCFDRLCALACALGRHLSKSDERLVFVIDEADMICTDKIQSRQLKLLVNKGRHDNVDTIAIARAPQRVHTDLRINCSQLVCFSLNDALALSAINKIGVAKSELALISSLGDKTYNYFFWKDSGEFFVFDRDGKITRKFNHAKDSTARL